MKKKLQMKHKVMIGAGAGVVAATAIAAPLAVTLSNNQIINPNNLDAVYGVDDNTYKSMKLRLVQVYGAKLTKEGWYGPEYDAKMNDLNDTISVIDEQVTKMKQSGSENIHTVATTVLMKRAKFNYGVDLERKTRANWNEVQTMFSGMKDSFGTYMENHNISRTKQAQVLAMADQKYNTMMNSIKSEYANDILGGVLKAKTQLISCFDSINAEIAKLAGSIRLNEFITNYSFEFREDASSYQSAPAMSNRMDKIAQQLGNVGDPISVDNMQKMFVIYNTETRQPVDFETNMIPGYVLTPKFAGFKSDGITNQHSILIDWTIVSQNVEAKDVEASTAHLMEVDEQLVNVANSGAPGVQSISDIFDKTGAKVKLMNYELLTTSTNESKLLQETYFNKAANGEAIELTWDSSIAHKYYDGFMYADETSSEPQYLNLRQLAKTGIVIKTDKESRLLQEVIDTVDVEGYEPKNLIEKFVKYCDVQDEVKFEHNANGVILVTNTFKAYYKNDETWNQHYQDALGTYAIGPSVPASSAEFQISEDFFESVNNAFNLSYEQAHRYIGKSYQKMAKVALACEIIQDLALVVTGIAIDAMIIACLVAALVQDWPAVLTLFIAAAAFAGIFYLQFMFGDKFRKKIYNPITDYAARADQFVNDAEYDKVNDKLNTDKSHFAMWVGDSKKPDPQEYKEKLDDFKKLSPQDQKKYFNTYYYFSVDFAKTFFEQAIKLEIDPQKFSTDFGDWVNEGGKYFFINMGIFLGVGALIAAVMLIVRVEARIHARKVSEQETFVEESEWVCEGAIRTSMS